MIDIYKELVSRFSSDDIRGIAVLLEVMITTISYVSFESDH